jgi:hypothetical protein
LYALRLCPSDFGATFKFTGKEYSFGVKELVNKYLKFFDELAESMISPETVMRKKIDEKDTNSGIFVAILFLAILGLLIGAIFAGLTRITVLPIVFMILFVVFGLIELFIWVGITHLIAKFIFRGKGNFSNLFGLFGFTLVTSILLIFGLSALLLAGTFFSAILLYTISWVWSIIIAVIAVDSEHKIGMGRSFLSTMGIPVLIIIALIFLVEVL